MGFQTRKFHKKIEKVIKITLKMYPKLLIKIRNTVSGKIQIYWLNPLKVGFSKSCKTQVWSFCIYVNPSHLEILLQTDKIYVLKNFFNLPPKTCLCNLSSDQNISWLHFVTKINNVVFLQVDYIHKYLQH